MVVSLPSFLLACACHIPGVISSADSSTCDNATGQCFCKTLVTGRACDTCVDTHWNLSPSNEAGCEGIEHWRFILCLLSYVLMNHCKVCNLLDKTQVKIFAGSLRIFKDLQRPTQIFKDLQRSYKDPEQQGSSQDLMKIYMKTLAKTFSRILADRQRFDKDPKGS